MGEKKLKKNKKLYRCIEPFHFPRRKETHSNRIHCLFFSNSAFFIMQFPETVNICSYQTLTKNYSDSRKKRANETLWWLCSAHITDSAYIFSKDEEWLFKTRYGLWLFRTAVLLNLRFRCSGFSAASQGSSFRSNIRIAQQRVLIWCRVPSHHATLGC